MQYIFAAIACIMEKKWPVLKHPPVDVALFQLKFDMGESALADLISNDSEIRKKLPIRHESVSAEVNFPNTKITIRCAPDPVGKATEAALELGKFFFSKSSLAAVSVDAVKLVIEPRGRPVKIIVGKLSPIQIKVNVVEFLPDFRIPDGFQSFLSLFHNMMRFLTPPRREALFNQSFPQIVPLRISSVPLRDCVLIS